MKIALAQLDVKAGRPRKNVARMIEMIEDAKNAGADLVAFPEMSVGGYLVGDKWTDEAWCQNLMDYNSHIQKASKGIVVVYGNVFMPNTGLKGYDGRRAKYNSAYVMEDGRWLGNFHKTLLPNYRIFDDKRYFLSSSDYRDYDLTIPIELSSGFKLGVEICEDMWWENYGNNVTKTLVDRGADLVVNISCSPWTFGKGKARDNRIKGIKKEIGNKFVPFYYVNAVGMQNNGKNFVMFDGDSCAYNSYGDRLLNFLKPYEENILYFDSQVEYGIETARQENKIKQKMDAIIRAFRGIDEILDWKPNYVYGLSGGIDSSLSVALAVIALGVDRIRGYNLPSKYNSKATKNAARQLAENLDITYKTIPIDDMVKPQFEWLKYDRENYDDLPSLIEENIQAKVRGTSILSNLAALNNGVMTNNGNKLEIAIGYSTLYGDVNGVFAPLGDLTKQEVFEMARYINEHYGNIIPQELIPDEDYNFEIEPSAELKNGQIDPMKWGYHDRMIEMMMDFKKVGAEDFMEWYLNGELSTKMGISESLITKYNLDDPKVFVDDLEWFVKTIQKNVFKRIQAPPIVLLSKTAYGYDLRESQFVWEPTIRYEKLKERILKGAE